MAGGIAHNSRREKFILILSGLHKRISLTLKMVIATVIVGTVMWYSFDILQAKKLESIFQSQFNVRLSDQALIDRLSFDRYVKAHLHSTKLFVSQRDFSEYIETQKWVVGDIVKIKHHRRSPDWIPKSSILRTFAHPRFALLLDTGGTVREVYNGRNENLPEKLLNPSQYLIMKSSGQNFITQLDNKPYLIASERYLGPSGKVKAVFMLASPIDDAFLVSALGSIPSGHIVALLSSDESPHILASSDLTVMPAGTRLKDLEKNYLVTGHELFDYGASEQVIRFFSFIHKKAISTLVSSTISTERYLRIIGLPVVIISFALLMFWVTRRIELLTLRVSDFSERKLGVKPGELQKGDQINALEDRFQKLTDEVLAARDNLKREAEEKLLLQKKNMEMEQKEQDLVFLQSITQAIGIGVMTDAPEGKKAANQQMEVFAWLCGGLSKFDINKAENDELVLYDRNAEKRIFNISSPAIFNEEKICLVRDITEIREETDALEHMAMHDALTGLPNRALLQDRLQQAIFTGQREEKEIALLMMDLDRFKEINDTLGHHIGDVVLRMVGSRLPEVLRKSDTFARLGGDEFAVVLPSTDSEHAKQTALKLLKALEEPFVVDDNNLHVGASLGIVFFPDHGDDASTLMKRADVAMYVAKNNQSGMAVYNPEHDQHSIKNLVLVSELRHAIEKEELKLYYQPKIDIKTGRIRGLEALVRWNHVQHGYIEPNEFIPLAEYTGLIKPLTSWVLKTAMHQYMKWHQGGMDIGAVISVNLSSISLLDPFFSEEVESQVKAYGVEPGNIEFEITESAVMGDPDLALKTVKQLSEMGVRLSIDNFGTGYSSLAYLKKLPVNEIKIDKSFVMNMTNDESDEMIVRSTIDLAHNLGLDVIAEGVDSEEIWKKLDKLECDGAQGFYICVPLPAEELVSWLDGMDQAANRDSDRPILKT